MDFIFILFYVLGLALIFAELFIPGGVVGTFGTILVIGTIGFAVWSPNHGWIYAVPMLLLTLILIPIMLKFGISRMTHTEELSVEEASPFKVDLSELQGQEGMAITPLRPSGMVKIGNRRVDAVAENELIPKDALVKVVRVDGQHVVVRNLKV